MMENEELRVIAVKAVDDLNLPTSAVNYIAGVIAMVLRFQATEYEELLTEANSRYRGEGRTAAEFQAAVDALTAERDQLAKSVDSLRTELADLRHRAQFPVGVAVASQSIERGVAMLERLERMYQNIKPCEELDDIDPNTVFDTPKGKTESPRG